MNLTVLFIGLFLIYLSSASKNIQISLPLIDGYPLDFTQSMDNKDNVSPGSLIRFATKMMDPKKMTPEMATYGLNMIKQFVRLPLSQQEKQQSFNFADGINYNPFSQPKNQKQFKNQLNKPTITKKYQSNNFEVSAPHKKCTVVKNQNIQATNPQIQQIKQQRSQIIQNTLPEIPHNQLDRDFKRSIDTKEKRNINNVSYTKEQIQNKHNVQINPITNTGESERLQQTENINKVLDERNNDKQQQKQHKQSKFKNTQIQNSPLYFPKLQQQHKNMITAQKDTPIILLSPQNLAKKQKILNYNTNEHIPNVSHFDFKLPQRPSSDKFCKGWRSYEGNNMINGEGNYIKGKANRINGHGNIVICP